MRFWSLLLFSLSVVASSTVPDASKEEGGSRIVGGLEARKGQFPFIVGIWSKRHNYRPFCGGSLITSRLVNG